MIFEKIPLGIIFEKFRAAILLRIGIQSNWHCCMNWLSWTSAVQLSDIHQVRDYRFQVRREITHRVDGPKTWIIIRLECQGLILPGRFRRRDCSWSRLAVCVPEDSRGPGFWSMSYRVGPVTGAKIKAGLHGPPDGLNLDGYFPSWRCMRSTDWHAVVADIIVGVKILDVFLGFATVLKFLEFLEFPLSPSWMCGDIINFHSVRYECVPYPLHVRDIYIYIWEIKNLFMISVDTYVWDTIYWPIDYTSRSTPSTSD